EGVGDLRAVEVILEPVTGRHRCDVVGHRPYPLGVAELAAQVFVHVARGAWSNRRIQLVAAPDDVDVIGVLELLQRRLETPLADVAPRTDEVGPDLDQHVTALPVTRPRARWRTSRRHTTPIRSRTNCRSGSGRRRWRPRRSRPDRSARPGLCVRPT